MKIITAGEARKWTLSELSALCTIRYEEAIDKYESVMKTETTVPYYTNLAKERICHCLVKVSDGLDLSANS